MANKTFKSMRKASGLHQRTIARELGLHTRTVTAWESGKPDARGKTPRPSWETCQRLAPLLNVSAEAIANSFGIPSPEQQKEITWQLKAGEWLKEPEDYPPVFVSLERLYHYRCPLCNAWWSIADRKPKEFVHCPDCSARLSVKDVLDGDGVIVDPK